MKGEMNMAMEMYSTDNGKVKVFYNQFAIENPYTVKKYVRCSSYGYWEYVSSFSNLTSAVNYAKKIFVA